MRNHGMSLMLFLACLLSIAAFLGCSDGSSDSGSSFTPVVLGKPLKTYKSDTESATYESYTFYDNGTFSYNEYKNGVEDTEEQITGYYAQSDNAITFNEEMIVTISGGKLTFDEMIYTRKGNSNTFTYSKTDDDFTTTIMITFNSDGSTTNTLTINGISILASTIQNAYEGDPSHDGVIKLKVTTKGTLSDEDKTLTILEDNPYLEDETYTIA